MLVGVDIGGTKTAVTIAEELPRILFREEFPTQPDQGPEHALQKIHELIECGLKRVGKPSSFRIGVSCGGPLDRVRGVIQSPPNLPNWNDVRIKDILEERFHVPCLVENDANAGAVAEHRYGAGQGCQNVIFLTMGTGFGAGLILNGELYRGANELAGEIGHLRLTETGPVGYGKAGSVEGWASGRGMALHAADAVAAAIESGTHTSLSENHHLQQLTAQMVGDAAAQGDAVAQQIIRKTGERLGETLAILVDLLNPERIIIGGLALRLGDLLFDPALNSMRREALPQSGKTCMVVRAGLGKQIGDISALCVAAGLTNRRA
ncbi:MAG TPA: ROK family protein [Acidobacteriaceae bacterium]|jgi:glucokinase|nr:ROK family protein [Acidobacteriaceae bacterium]